MAINSLIAQSMNRLSALDWVAVVILVIGGLNWGLVGLFGFDLVAAIFGDMSVLTRIIYVLVGVSAVYVAVVVQTFKRP